MTARNEASLAPERWAPVRLADIAEVRLGRQRSPDRATGPNLRPYLRAGNVTWRGFDLSEVYEMDFTPEEQEIYRLQANDILLNEASGSASEVGKPAIWDGRLKDICFQNTLLRVRAPEQLVRFLYWRFLHDARNGAFADASRGVGIHHLSSSGLSEWRLSLPPVGEQVRLADALDEHFSRLDAADALLESARSRLERFRASVLQAAVTGRLVPTEAELARRERRSFEPASVLLERSPVGRRRRWDAAGRRGTYQAPTVLDPSSLPSLPDGWSWTAVDVAGDVLLGRQRSPQYLTGRFSRPYLRVANVKDDRLDVSDVKEMDFDADHFARYRLLPGDILVSEGQSPERVGESAIYRGGIDGLCFQKTLHRFRADPALTSPEFAQIVFRAHVRSGVFLRLASITTNIAHLTLEKFCAAPFPLPPRVEQDRIVEQVDSMLTEESAVDALLESTRLRISALRRSILRRAFSGGLVDADPNDEPVSVLLDRIRALRPNPRATPQASRSRKKNA